MSSAVWINKGCCSDQPQQLPLTVYPEGIQDEEKQDTHPR